MTHQNIFGTDGIRAKVGTFPLTPQEIPKLGNAIAQWAQVKYKKPSILLAHDTRQSCAWIKSALQSGLLLSSITIFDAGVLPTPGVCKLIQESDKYDLGIIISASHNPFHDNGIKIIQKSGKLDQKDEQHISLLFKKNEPSIRNEFGSLTPYPQAYQEYKEKLLRSFKPSLLSKKKIILDCAHGATSHIAPDIFRQLGATVIAINTTPNGKNINLNCGTLFPSTLSEYVLNHSADIGFAFDGDGDRVIAVAKDGVIKNGDDILALLIQHPLYTDQPVVVGTSMSNYGLDIFLQHKNKKLERTKVGDKYVARFLKKNNLLLGGEQSGHIIMRDYLSSGDGIFTALRVLEVLEKTQNWKMETFVEFPQLLINVHVKEKKELQNPPFSRIIASYSNKIKTGRLIIRYSGTEPVLRIMIEHEDRSYAQNIGTHLAQELKDELQ